MWEDTMDIKGVSVHTMCIRSKHNTLLQPHSCSLKSKYQISLLPFDGWMTDIKEQQRESGKVFPSSHQSDQKVDQKSFRLTGKDQKLVSHAGVEASHMGEYEVTHCGSIFWHDLFDLDSKRKCSQKSYSLHTCGSADA